MVGGGEGGIWVREKKNDQDKDLGVERRKKNTKTRPDKSKGAGENPKIIGRWSE